MNLLKKKTTTIIQTAFLAAGLYGVFAIAFPSSIQAQGKSCNSACSLYYDCFSIAFQYTDEGKTAQGKANLKKKKKSIINKCIKECSTKQSSGNILQCYKTRTPTIPVCKAFYSCAVKYYKAD